MKNLDAQKLLGKLKALSPKNLFAVLGLVVLAFIAFDVLLIARPQLTSLIALNDKSKQLKLDIKELSDSKLRLPKFRVTLDDARVQKKSFESMVHKEDEIPSVLKTISTLANEYGVKIDQLVPQKSDGVILVKAAEGNYTGLSILVLARAGYHDLGRFLNRLQQESVFWQLESINIAADDRDVARHAVKMQMKILILGR
jgi:Tfp pilus assembly protein PilO